jgi:hypothetical protein
MVSLGLRLVLRLMLGVVVPEPPLQINLLLVGKVLEIPPLLLIDFQLKNQYLAHRR